MLGTERLVLGIQASKTENCWRDRKKCWQSSPVPRGGLCGKFDVGVAISHMDRFTAQSQALCNFLFRERGELLFFTGLPSVQSENRRLEN